jgi:prohibitin 1
MIKNTSFNSAGKLTALLFLITLFLTPCVIVNAGERGVLMKFGEVQNQILGEGTSLNYSCSQYCKKVKYSSPKPRDFG